MFAAINWMPGMVQPKMGRQKAMTARWTAEWDHEEKGGEVLAWRLRASPQEAILLAPRTAQGAAHFICSLSLPCSDLPTSSQRIDDLFPSVKKTEVPCGSRIEKNGMFIGEPSRLHMHLRKPPGQPEIPSPRPIES